MRKKYASKAAQKFQRFAINKVEEVKAPISSTTVTFSTHSLSQSQAEILLPANSIYKEKSEQMVIEIKVGKIIFYAEMNDASFADKSFQGVSILHNLINLMGVPNEPSGKYMGEVTCIDKSRIPQSQHLEYAQILVKNIYLSRRDQYKLLKNLKQRNFIHVYNRKNLYFDKLSLQITNLLHKDDEIRKAGVITKNTKIIFRSSCSKYTVLFQISKEMFDLNQEKELYLEKGINFLILFLQRNIFFNTKHRIEIVLFARLFYPQFKTLKEAYHDLISQKDGKYGNNAFTTNYASGLQKDYKGRIFQDAYRRILWSGSSVAGFRQKFWERVSEFMFTLNWEKTQSYAKHISKTVQNDIEKSVYEQKKPIKVYRRKPFLHKLKCQLSSSEQSCFFEAISLIAEQYKHHYYYRSLEQTGNAITIISAGKSNYTTDETVYKMAKSNIYLTNISCTHVNLKRRQSFLKVKIIRIKQKPKYKKEDAEKLKDLIDWCIEQEAYLSPTNNLLNFKEDFQTKSIIYPKKLRILTQNQKINKYPHYCEKRVHYIFDENSDDEIELIPEQQFLKQKQKVKKVRKIPMWRDKVDQINNQMSKINGRTITWISTYYMNQMSFELHKIFYDNFNFEVRQMAKKNKDEPQYETDFKTFERDLNILKNRNTYHSLEDICQNSRVCMKNLSYISKMRWNNQEGIKQFESNIKQGRHILGIEIQQMNAIIFEQNYSRKLFQITNLAPDKDSKQKIQQISSDNDNEMDDQQKSVTQVQEWTYEEQNGIEFEEHRCDEDEATQIKQKSSYGYSLQKHSNDQLAESPKINKQGQQNQKQQKQGLREEDKKSIDKMEEAEKSEDGDRKLSEQVNILQRTRESQFYSRVSKYGKYAVKKSHNKERLAKNYPHSTLHYMMTFFSQKGQKWLNTFIEIQQPRNQMEKMILECVQMEKEWKNIIFPILTPIYTNYDTNIQDLVGYPDRTSQGKSAIQNQISRNLMDNFQIAEENSNSVVMSKGHVQLQIRVNNPKVAPVLEYIDEKKQQQITPNMFYRYLVYEQKDYRFSSKSINFTNQNFYNKAEKIQQKKSLKLVMISQSTNGDPNCFFELIKMLSEKYKQIKLELEVSQNSEQKEMSRKFKITLSNEINSKIYKNQSIEVQIDKFYYPSRLFEIYVEWDYCCATLVRDFVDAITSTARRNKIITHQMGRNNAFDVNLSISTIGQIFFSSETAMSILETDIINNKQWLWDMQGYYMDRNGEAFIRFIPQKNLIEWKDNLMDKNKWKKMQSDANLYERFFMKSAAYDFIGSIIDSFTSQNSRKNSLALST